MSAVLIARKHIAFSNHIHTDGIESQTGSRLEQQLGELTLSAAQQALWVLKCFGAFYLLYQQIRC